LLLGVNTNGGYLRLLEGLLEPSLARPRRALLLVRFLNKPEMLASEPL
jgi:hypothetical protein